MSDYSKLRELAERATPGPWWMDPPTPFAMDQVTVYGWDVEGGDREAVEITATFRHENSEDTQETRDLQYIAAANPTTVLALLDRLAELEAREGAGTPGGGAPQAPYLPPPGVPVITKSLDNRWKAWLVFDDKGKATRIGLWGRCLYAIRGPK